MITHPEGSGIPLAPDELLSELSRSLGTRKDLARFFTKPDQPRFRTHETIPLHVSGWIRLEDVYWTSHYFGRATPFFYRMTPIPMDPRPGFDVEVRRVDPITAVARFFDPDFFSKRMLDESSWQSRSAIDAKISQDLNEFGEVAAGGPVFIRPLLAFDSIISEIPLPPHQN